MNRRSSLCQRQTTAGVVGVACWGLEAGGSAGGPLQTRDAASSRRTNRFKVSLRWVLRARSLNGRREPCGPIGVCGHECHESLAIDVGEVQPRVARTSSGGGWGGNDTRNDERRRWWCDESDPRKKRSRVAEGARHGGRRLV